METFWFWNYRFPLWEKWFFINIFYWVLNLLIVNLYTTTASTFHNFTKVQGNYFKSKSITCLFYILITSPLRWSLYVYVSILCISVSLLMQLHCIRRRLKWTCCARRTVLTVRTVGSGESAALPSESGAPDPSVPRAVPVPCYVTPRTVGTAHNDRSAARVTGHRADLNLSISPPHTTVSSSGDKVWRVVATRCK